jgi:ligand-binding sensor domain-containing protein
MPPENRNLRFTRLSLERGLSQSFVTSILQDETGFMWFGSEDGLNRYNGYDFTVYKYDPQDRTSLSHSFVHAVYQDRAGFLWIGTDRGLNRWIRLRRVRALQHDPPTPRASATTGPDHFRGLREAALDRDLRRIEPFRPLVGELHALHSLPEQPDELER